MLHSEQGQNILRRNNIQQSVAKRHNGHKSVFYSIEYCSYGCRSIAMSDEQFTCLIYQSIGVLLYESTYRMPPYSVDVKDWKKKELRAERETFNYNKMIFTYFRFIRRKNHNRHLCPIVLFFLVSMYFRQLFLQIKRNVERRYKIYFFVPFATFFF